MKLNFSYSEYADVTVVAAQVPDGSGGRFAVGFNVIGHPDRAALEEIADTIARRAKTELLELFGKTDDPVLSWSRVRLVPEQGTP